MTSYEYPTRYEVAEAMASPTRSPDVLENPFPFSSTQFNAYSEIPCEPTPAFNNWSSTLDPNGYPPSLPQEPTLPQATASTKSLVYRYLSEFIIPKKSTKQDPTAPNNPRETRKKRLLMSDNALFLQTTRLKKTRQLRMGYWTEEETQYACRLMMNFIKGIAGDVPEGTPLREYLIVMLQCYPMRISKRLALGGKLCFEKAKAPMSTHEFQERTKDTLRHYRKFRASLRNESGSSFLYNDREETTDASQMTEEEVLSRVFKSIPVPTLTQSFDPHSDIQDGETKRKACSNPRKALPSFVHQLSGRINKECGEIQDFDEEIQVLLNLIAEEKEERKKRKLRTNQVLYDAFLKRKIGKEDLDFELRSSSSQKRRHIDKSSRRPSTKSNTSRLESPVPNAMCNFPSSETEPFQNSNYSNPMTTPAYSTENPRMNDTPPMLGYTEADEYRNLERFSRFSSSPSSRASLMLHFQPLTSISPKVYGKENEGRKPGPETLPSVSSFYSCDDNNGNNNSNSMGFNGPPGFGANNQPYPSNKDRNYYSLYPPSDMIQPNPSSLESTSRDRFIPCQFTHGSNHLKYHLTHVHEDCEMGPMSRIPMQSVEPFNEEGRNICSNEDFGYPPSNYSTSI